MEYKLNLTDEEEKLFLQVVGKTKMEKKFMKVIL